ncbi:MAG: VCBS repeat-containing protein [Bryobacteraceae bacterium]
MSPPRPPRIRIGLLLAVAAFSQQASYRVEPKFEKSLPIEEVLAKIDARKDTWIGEQDYESIHEELEAAAQRFKKGEPAFPALDALAARFRAIAVVQLKVVSSARASASDPDAAIGIRVEVAGAASDGSPLSLQGHWDTRWQRTGDHWSLASIAPAQLREVHAGAIRFTDISTAAFGANASYARQLSKSVDHWRGLLDESTGVDIYGHNGLAVGDYDGDGLEDLYIAQPSGLPNRLYRNNGDSTFTDVTYTPGAAPLAILDDTRAILFADFDNDGDQDLFAVTASQPLLFRNDGGGRFAVDRQSGLTIPAAEAGSLTSAAIADYDNDGWLDVYVCSYDFWRPGRTYNSPTPYYDATNGPPNFLFRNTGRGKFVNATRAAGLSQNNNRYSFAAAWGDFNADGRPDLYVANDFGRNNLYLNRPDGTFTDVAAEAGVGDLGAGMSAAWGDYDNDGRLDLYTGNMWSSAGQRVTGNRQFSALATGETLAAFQRQAKGNSLFRNAGNGRFEEQTQAGVEMGRWAWASDFADLDNDGNLDLYIQNGYITGPDLRDL